MIQIIYWSVYGISAAVGMLYLGWRFGHWIFGTDRRSTFKREDGMRFAEGFDFKKLRARSYDV